MTGGYKRPRCSLPFGHKGKHHFEWRPGVEAKGLAAVSLWPCARGPGGRNAALKICAVHYRSCPRIAAHYARQRERTP